MAGVLVVRRETVVRPGEWGRRAFVGLDPTRPAFLMPYWKVLLVRPADSWLHRAWSGFVSNEAQPLDALATAMWEYGEAVVVLCPRLTDEMVESCPRAFDYWQSDVREAFTALQQQTVGGSSAVQFRIEHVLGSYADFGVAVFSGRRREPPVIEGFAREFFRSGDGRSLQEWMVQWRDGTLAYKPDAAVSGRTAQRSGDAGLSEGSQPNRSKETAMSGKSGWDGIASEEILDKLEAKDIETDTVLLTINRAFIQTIPDKRTGEVRDEFLCIEFIEFPKKGLRCSKTMAASFRALQAAGKLQHGFNDIDASFPWEGLTVPIYKKEVIYDNPETREKEKFLKLFAVAPGGFDKALAEFPRLGGAAVRRTRAVTKQTTRRAK